MGLELGLGLGLGLEVEEELVSILICSDEQRVCKERPFSCKTNATSVLDTPNLLNETTIKRMITDDFATTE